MDCPGCGSANPEGKGFCGECGAPLPLHCAACGAENPPGKKFCGDCGAALTDAARAPVAATESKPGARSGEAAAQGWFTEGFETADLRDAKALLDALCK